MSVRTCHNTYYTNIFAVRGLRAMSYVVIMFTLILYIYKFAVGGLLVMSCVVIIFTLLYVFHP